MWFVAEEVTIRFSTFLLKIQRERKRAQYSEKKAFEWIDLFKGQKSDCQGECNKKQGWEWRLIYHFQLDQLQRSRFRRLCIDTRWAVHQHFRNFIRNLSMNRGVMEMLSYLHLFSKFRYIRNEILWANAPRLHSSNIEFAFKHNQFLKDAR